MEAIPTAVYIHSPIKKTRILLRNIESVEGMRSRECLTDVCYTVVVRIVRMDNMSIQINSAMAQRNGVTMDDVNLLIDALQHMFEEDMSSSRALTLRKLFVVEHTKPMGNAYRDTIERALAARLKQPNDAPTSYEDYEVTYHREMLPDEVKVTEYNYNSQSV